MSACLLSYKRPQNMPAIVRSLRAASFIDEILIWNNDPATEIPVTDPDVRVIRAPENRGCLGRFECAQHARNEIVYVQDDDVVVENLGELYATFRADPTRIAHTLSPQHFAARERELHGPCHTALVGWGALFPRQWLDVLDRVPADLRATPLYRREADKFFSLLLERHHSTILGRLRHLDGHSSPQTALWLEPEHGLMTALAVREALAVVRTTRPIVLPVPWHVVVVSGNYGRYLEEAVVSVLGNAADFALTIVDDASVDDTPERAADLARRYPRISVLRNDESRGAGHSRNRGLASVDSSFAILLDADDRIGPNYLRQAERTLKGGCDVANPDAILFGDHVSRWPVPDVATLPMILRHNRVHCCSAFRRCWWAQVGGVDETFPYLEDYDLWLRMAAAGARIRAVPGDHFYYRQHADSATKGPVATADELWRRFYDKHADLYRSAA